MRTGIVTSAEILATPGHPLSARYWLTRQEGESHEAWQRRTELEREVRLVRSQLARLRRLHPDAWAVVEREGQS